MEAFETVELSTDLLIVGGGMAACGAAFEASYWAKKNNLSVLMVDKAALDRSGAVAMGLSAINTYIGVGRGENTCEDFVEYVQNDQMGTVREDLVYDVARHVDSSACAGSSATVRYEKKNRCDNFMDPAGIRSWRME